MRLGSAADTEISQGRGRKAAYQPQPAVLYRIRTICVLYGKKTTCWQLLHKVMRPMGPILTENGLVLKNPLSDCTSVVNGDWKRMLRSEAIFHVDDNTADPTAEHSTQSSVSE